MHAAIKNRLEAKTPFEKAEAATWIRMILLANKHGEDLDQFIPQDAGKDAE